LRRPSPHNRSLNFASSWPTLYLTGLHLIRVHFSHFTFTISFAFSFPRALIFFPFPISQNPPSLLTILVLNSKVHTVVEIIGHAPIIWPEKVSINVFSGVGHYVRRWVRLLSRRWRCRLLFVEVSPIQVYPAEVFIESALFTIIAVLEVGCNFVWFLWIFCNSMFNS